jgi:hypothetical protein
MVFKVWTALVAVLLAVTPFTEQDWESWVNPLLALAVFGTALYVACRDFRRGNGDAVSYLYMLVAVLFNPLIPALGGLEETSSKVVAIAVALLFTSPMWADMANMSNMSKK